MKQMVEKIICDACLKETTNDYIFVENKHLCRYCASELFINWYSKNPDRNGLIESFDTITGIRMRRENLQYC